MSVNTAYMSEVEIAFEKTTALKVEIETLIQQFASHKDKLSAKVAAIVNKAKALWKTEHCEVTEDKHNFDYNYEVIANGISRIRRWSTVDIDTYDRNDWEEGYLENFNSKQIADRKKFIARCAYFVQKATEFKDQLLMAINDANAVETKQIAAPKASKTVKQQQKTGGGFFATIKSAVSSAFNWIKKTATTVKDTVISTVNSVLAKIKSILA